MLPLIVTVCPSTGKMPRLAPVPTTTLPVTVNVVVRLQLALAGTMRLPLTVLLLGVGGQVVSAAWATGSATNMSPNASIAVSKCFMVFLPPRSGSVPVRHMGDRRLDILMGAGFEHKYYAPQGQRLRNNHLVCTGNPVRMPGFHPERTSSANG